MQMSPPETDGLQLSEGSRAKATLIQDMGVRLAEKLGPDVEE